MRRVAGIVIILTCLAILIHDAVRWPHSTFRQVYDTDDLNTWLCDAAVSGDMAKVKALLELGADVNTNDSGLTPLDWAAIDGSKDIAELLLENGANVNARGRSDRSALHYAVILGRVDVVRLLLDSGADANAKDDKGHTPLDWLEIASKNRTIKHKKKSEALLRKHGGKTGKELRK